MTERFGEQREPLLSICVPTYNRAKFLRVMLEALLPQAARLGGVVEVIVSDNASTDDTQSVVRAAEGLGPLRYLRNKSNLGPLANIIKPILEAARGRYVWVMGDHNLMRPDALAEVVAIVRANLNIEIFYANFRCATYPGDWPVAACGGHDGNYDYLGNESTDDYPVEHWSQLIQGGRSALCTQAYVHIVKRNAWVNYWKNRNLEPSFTSVASTYPHTVMIAESFFKAESFYIGNPVLTIFNGAQSWGSQSLQRIVYLQSLPKLIAIYDKAGLSDAQRIGAIDYCRLMARQVSEARFSEAVGANKIKAWFALISDAARAPYLLKPIWDGYRTSSRISGVRSK